MTTHALGHHPDRTDRTDLARWIAVGVVCGALAVLVCHQTVAMLLHSMGMTQRPP